MRILFVDDEPRMVAALARSPDAIVGVVAPRDEGRGVHPESGSVCP
jgi:hypothetical protein